MSSSVLSWHRHRWHSRLQPFLPAGHHPCHLNHQLLATTLQTVKSKSFDSDSGTNLTTGDNEEDDEGNQIVEGELTEC